MTAAAWSGLTWAEVGGGLRHVHRNGPATARYAEEAGKRPEDVALIRLSIADDTMLPILEFEDGSMVSALGPLS